MRLPLFNLSFGVKGHELLDKSFAVHAALAPAPPACVVSPAKAQSATSATSVETTNITLGTWIHAVLAQCWPHSSAIAAKLFAAFGTGTLPVLLRVRELALPTNGRHVIAPGKPDHFIAFRAMCAGVLSRVMYLAANFTRFKWSVDSLMLRICSAKTKVSQTVIVFYPINVVDHLSATKKSADRFFNDKSVLQHVSTTFCVWVIRAINMHVAIWCLPFMSSLSGKFARHETHYLGSNGGTQ